jgi:hypothetical protein
MRAPAPRRRSDAVAVGIVAVGILLLYILFYAALVGACVWAAVWVLKMTGVL